MSSNSDVMITIGGDTSSLESAFGKGKQALESFGAASKMLENVIQTGLIASLGALAVKTAEYGTEILNLSKISNTSVSEFQRMAAATATVGVEHEKLADILKDVNDKVGEFLETGGGPLVDFFEHVGRRAGVTADQFKNLSGPQALQLFVSTMEKANLPQKQMTFYMEALASDSTKLIPLLQGSGAELKKLGDEAEKTGQILSRQKLEDMHEADVKIKQSMETFKMLGITLMADILPAVNMVLDGWARLFSVAKNAASSVIEKIDPTTLENLTSRKERAEKRLAEIEATKANFAENHVVIGRRKLDLAEKELQAEIQLVNSLIDERKQREEILKKSEEIKQIEEERYEFSRPSDFNQVVSNLDLSAKYTKTGERQTTIEEANQDSSNQLSQDIGAINSDLQRQGAEAAKANQEALEALAGKYETEREMLDAHQHEMAELKLAYDEGIIQSDAELKEKLAIAEEESQQRLMAAIQAGRARQEAFDRLTLGNKVKLVTGSLMQMTAGVAQHSKTMFEINKGAAIADAIVSGAQGVAKTLATYPYPWNIPLAALHGAAAIAQVETIRHQQFNGGGGGVAPSLSTTPAMPTAQQGAGGGAAAPQSTLFVQGLSKDSLFSGDAVASLAGKLLDYQKNGGTVVLQGA